MKVKATVVKSIKVDAGPNRTKSFHRADAAAWFYATQSNRNFYLSRTGLSMIQISNREERLYRRVLPIFKGMLK